MIGFELLTLPTLALQIGFTDCRHHPPPRITAVVEHKDITYDTSKSHAELGGFEIDTVSPYESGVHSRVSGLMSGNINVSMSAHIAWSTHPLTRETCMWYDSVEIKIISEPTIYIASEHSGDRCRYNATRQHELKHVAADKKILKKYRGIFVTEVKRTARQIGVSGPFDSDRTDAIRANLDKKLQDSIKSVLNNLKAERRQSQQAIDSLAEYNRLSNLCN